MWILLAFLPARATVAQQASGSIRGTVRDADFDLPLPDAEVALAQSGQKARTEAGGNYLLRDVPPGRHTLIFSKEGYERMLRTEVVVLAGRMTEVDVRLAGEFTEMEEFVVQDVLRGNAASELALLQLRLESPALMDSIGADLMGRAGASDAASALRLVAGATVQDGKSAVIRGLPDRYVSSQLGGARLPSADEDKRAVELDQFPAAVIESIQVSKSFTPDQQGDASGGAVDVRLKGIPDEPFFQIKGQYGYDTQSTGRDDFLSYDGGGVGSWGRDGGGRDAQTDRLGESWEGAVGTSRDDSPTEHKWSIATGGKAELGNGTRVGGLLSFFYERDSSFYDDGIDDSYWVVDPGDPMTPETNQGTPGDGDFKTALFDVTRGTELVQWGGLATLGVESEHHSLSLAYLYTHTAEDSATLAEDTRGKEWFFPGYDRGDPTHPGNDPSNRFAAPYLRLETLEYSERTTGSLQLRGEHTLPIEPVGFGGVLELLSPRIGWFAADSFAELDQPDKRQFGALWVARSYNPGVPPFVPPFFNPPGWFPYKPGANFNLGNLQRIWKTIEEDSEQYALDLTLPFRQWSGNEGSLSLGLFDDQVERSFDQDTYSNFGDSGDGPGGDWDEPWSEGFPGESHPITESSFDVDYEGQLDVSAYYAMLELPLFPTLTLVGGVRWEHTGIGVVNDPEEDALWYPPGTDAATKLNPGEADVDFEQDDVLPAVGLVYQPFDSLVLRASYSETVARQTFKELTPIIQQEFLGGPIFIGNPDLGMSDVANHDLRLDYRPYDGGLLSLSWFRKEIEDPIEYVQKIAAQLDYTTAVNYPEGELEGWEVELRQQLGRLWKPLEGFAVGANATFIDSRVTLPEDEAAGFDLPNIDAPLSARHMTNAPEYLYNLFVTYDHPPSGTQVALFYTLQGDTLVAGAGQANGNFVPSVYATAFDTLNLSVSKKLGRFFELSFQAKNLTNAEIETVYRSEYIGDDVLKTSYTRGIELSVAIGAKFSF